MLLPARLLRGRTTRICSGANGGGAALDTAAFEELKVRTGQFCGDNAVACDHLDARFGRQHGRDPGSRGQNGQQPSRVWIMG
jgi:hypothetical protein